jgi:RNA polymerase sigma-32 factor
MINWNECKPLTDDELTETISKAQEGDPAAIEKLVRSNIKLAASIAHEYNDFAGLNTEDLTSEAILGLMIAIPRFDPEKGTKFTTYANYWMRQRVLKSVRETFRLVKIGTTQAQKKLFWRLHKESEALRKEGLEVNAASIAERLDVRTQDVEDMQIRMSASEASLDAVNPTDPQGATLLDTLDSGATNPERYTTRKRMQAWVQDRMVEFEQRLSEKELAVWNYRIASEEPETMEKVAARIGTSKQYVSQTEKRIHKAFTKYARNKARG